MNLSDLVTQRSSCKKPYKKINHKDLDKNLLISIKTKEY